MPGHNSGMLLHRLAVLASFLTSSLELWRGRRVEHVATQPALPLTLYEYEACPYCRLVREALTALHLDAEIRPCPRKGKRFRPEALRLGGKRQFPLLVDPNTDKRLYESRDIVSYLFQTYGAGALPPRYEPHLMQALSNVLVLFTRFGRGGFARASNAPAQPLQLWSFEANPHARLVRERMCELELPYTLHNLGEEPSSALAGGKRAAFAKAHGHVQLPYLEDPNTGRALSDSQAILEYLQQTYAA